MRLGNSNYQHGAGLVATENSSAIRGFRGPLPGTCSVRTVTNSRSKSVQASAVKDLALAADGASRGNAARRQKPSEEATEGLVLSAKHNAPMHPGLLAQSLNKQQKPRGRPKKQSKPRTLPDEAKQKKQPAAKRQVQPRQPRKRAVPAMNVQTVVEASSSNVQQPRRRGRPPKTVKTAPGESAAAATAAVRQAKAAGIDADPSSSTAAPPRQHSPPPQTMIAQQQLPWERQQDMEQVVDSTQPSLMDTQMLLDNQLIQQHAQQQQQLESQQLPGPGQPFVDPVTSSSDLILHSLLGDLPDSSTGSTDQRRFEMERLFGLPAASIPGMSPWSATSTAAFDSSDEGAAQGISWNIQQQQQQQQPEPASQQQQQQQQSSLGPKGFKLTSIMQGKSPYVTRPSGQRNPREQEEFDDEESSSSNSSSDHAPAAAAPPEQRLGPGSPLEPTPLEPVHPEMQYDVQLQEENNRLQQHRQLLHDLKQGAAQYQQYLSDPVMRSLAYITPETLQALNSARQFVQQHPELARCVTVGQQGFDHVLTVSRKAAACLHNTQDLIAELEGILQQEEQRAGGLASSNTRHQAPQTGNRAPTHRDQKATVDGSPAKASGAVAADTPSTPPSAAAGKALAPSDERTRRASESLDMLQRLLPQLESAGSPSPSPSPPPQPQPDSDSDSDPHEDYQWG